MRTAIMATGGIGGYLAVKLGSAGHEIATIARGAHLDAIRQHGLALDRPGGRETLAPRLATDDPAQVGLVDAVIFGVKGAALEDTARACLPMLSPNTAVVPFLNGVEAADRLANVMPIENCRQRHGAGVDHHRRTGGNPADRQFRQFHLRRTRQQPLPPA